MARKVVNLTIRLKDGVSSVLGRIRRGVGGLIKNIFSLQSALSGLALASPFIALGRAIKKAFNFETARIQLKVLLGSMDAAKKRFKELQQFSAQTPFQLPDIIKASRLLSVFSENMMGGAESLKLVGDAAASVNQTIGDVAFWFGRAYSLIQAGKPFGEAALRLQEMGILSAKGTIEIQKLQEAGAGADKIFEALTKEFKKFNGGMEELSQTGNGLISTLKDNWTLAVSTFGDAFMDVAKGGLRTMIDALKELREDGTIQKWAESAREAFDYLAAGVKILATGAGDGRRAFASAVGGVIVAAFKDGVALIGTALAFVFGKGASILGNTLKDNITDLALKGVGLVADMTRALGAFIVDLGKSLLDKAPEIGRKIADGIKSAIPRLGKGLTNREMPDIRTPSTLPGDVRMRKDEFGTPSEQGIQPTKTALDGVTESVKKQKEATDKNTKTITESTDGAGGALEDFTEGLMEAIAQIRSANLDEALKTLAGQLEKAMPDKIIDEHIPEYTSPLEDHLKPAPFIKKPTEPFIKGATDPFIKKATDPFIKSLGDLSDQIDGEGTTPGGLRGTFGDGGNMMGGDQPRGLRGSFSGMNMIGVPQAMKDEMAARKKKAKEEAEAVAEGSGDSEKLEEILEEIRRGNEMIHERLGGVQGG
jgi:hypothetical protein